LISNLHIFTAVSVQIGVFQIMILCNPGVGYQNLEEHVATIFRGEVTRVNRRPCFTEKVFRIVSSLIGGRRHFLVVSGNVSMMQKEISPPGVSE
jgi:hypothetical protein